LKSKLSLDHQKGRFFLRKHYIRDYLLGGVTSVLLIYNYNNIFCQEKFLNRGFVSCSRCLDAV